MTAFALLTDPEAARTRSLVLDVAKGTGSEFASALFGPETMVRAGETLRAYRYALVRWWDREKPLLVWVMLNPSTADAFKTDATVTRVIARSKATGAGGCIVLNLFGFRSKDPAEMKSRLRLAVGGHNDPVIDYVLSQPVAGVVAAWGQHGTFRKRSAAVLPRLVACGHPLLRLDEPLTSSGQPRHPLMVANAVDLVPWDGTAA